MIDRFWKGNIKIGCSDVNNEIKAILLEYDKSGIDLKRKLFYAVKPIIPRIFQLSLRKKYASKMQIGDYEGVETIYNKYLEDIVNNRDDLFYFIWFWPKNYQMVCIVTHDVETKEGFRNVIKLADIDDKLGIKSSFEFVPEKYKIDFGIFEELRRRGFEIAVHGLKHDGQLFYSKRIFNEKLLKINKYAEQWQAGGFRSPSLIRIPLWMKAFEFDWDSSIPDWDPYGPQTGGCRTVFPYFLSEKTLELPVTLMQDHTLFEILGQHDIKIWKNKIDYLYSIHGLANIIIHPDYIFHDGRLTLYYEYIEYLREKKSVWYALPNEISKWWRKRDASNLKADENGKYYIEGITKSDTIISNYEKLNRSIFRSL